MDHLGCVFFPAAELGHLRRAAGTQTYPNRHAAAGTHVSEGEALLFSFPIFSVPALYLIHTAAALRAEEQLDLAA